MYILFVTCIFIKYAYLFVMDYLLSIGMVAMTT